MSLAQLAVGIGAVALTFVLYILKATRDNEHRLSVLETKISLFWTIIEEVALGLLHRDDTPELDMLLAKVSDPHHRLTREEASAVVEHLKEIEVDRSRPRGESAMALLVRAVLVAKYLDD